MGEQAAGGRGAGRDRLFRAYRTAPFVRLPAAAPGQRIGLMGGSFNPPHRGHLDISRAALRRLRLDRVWWLVTPGNPLKAGASVPPLDVRLGRCRELAQDPRIAVTGFEAELGTSYAVDTLSWLRKRHRGVRFVWLMGADNLAQFHRWRAFRRIAGLMPFAVLDRPGWRLPAVASPAAHALARWRLPEAEAGRLADLSPPAWVFLTVRLSHLSSTALRAAARGTESRKPRNRK